MRRASLAVRSSGGSALAATTSPATPAVVVMMVMAAAATTAPATAVVTTAAAAAAATVAGHRGRDREDRCQRDGCSEGQGCEKFPGHEYSCRESRPRNGGPA